MKRGTGRRRYLKTDDLETKAKQIDDIFLQEEQNQKQVDRELSLLKEDMFRESQVREYTLHRVRAEYALGLSWCAQSTTRGGRVPRDRRWGGARFRPRIALS
jgi:hypothetical protein